MILSELTNKNINDSLEVNSININSSNSPNIDLITVDININNHQINENIPIGGFEEIKNECTALVPVKPNSLFVAQNMFKKSIKISIKSFLISLSLSFLNLFF